MKQLSRRASKPVALLPLAIMLLAGVAPVVLRADEWHATVGAESPDRGSQALAFLANELWVHAGDTVRWFFRTHERHTVTFLKPGQARPPIFSPMAFGVEVGCPGTTPDGSSVDGSTCVHSGILLLPGDAPSNAPPLTYSVQFPTAGNFRFHCLAHADMTGVIHVLSPAEALPHDQRFYDREAQSQQVMLLADTSRLEGQGVFRDQDQSQSTAVAAGVGEIVTTTGAGSQTGSLMRFVRDTIVVRVGDTVEWTSLDPSINHTVTFGVEPADPRLPSGNVSMTADGARRALIGTPSDSVNSGFLSPAPQDRVGLAETAPGITRFRLTFTAPGTFDYICAIHDELGMKGTVIVH